MTADAVGSAPGVPGGTPSGVPGGAVHGTGPAGGAGPRVIRFPRATAAVLGGSAPDRAGPGAGHRSWLLRRSAGAPGSQRAPGHQEPGEPSYWVATSQGRLLVGCLGLLLLLVPDPTLRVLGGLLLAGVAVAWLRARRGRRRPSWGTTGSGLHRTGGAADVGRASAVRWAAIGAGISGEEAVVRTLTRGLPGGPGGYVLLQNLSLVGVGGDVDHVVVGPTGLFVLETKHVAGLIQHDAAGWRRTKVGRRGRPYDAYMDDPLAQVRRIVRGMRLYLERRDPGLCARTRLWITEMIVFSHPEARVLLSENRVPVYDLQSLVPAILGHRPAQALGPADVARIVELLTAGREPAPALEVPAP